MTYFVWGLPVLSGGRVGITAVVGTISKDSMLIDPATEEVTVDAGSSVTSQNGFRYRATQALLIEDLGGGAIGADVVHNGGLPFRGATGALIMDSLAAVSYCHGGIPFCSNGAVAAV